MADVPELLRVLSRLGVASAEELSANMKVSRPTVSRLLSEAGEQVARMGATRGRRYSRARHLDGVGVAQPVYQVSAAGQVTPWARLLLLHGGGHWVERSDGRREQFVGLPPWAAEMAPQGFLGRAFAVRYPELQLPARLGDWSDDHRLIALCRRGEDCVGNLVIGDESLNRFLASARTEVTRGQYGELARQSLAGEVGSSAGGEHPKFLAFSGGRHVLVKFYGGDESAASIRWRDLAIAEALSLDHIGRAGIPVSPAAWFDQGLFRFVEVERFDRIGPRGRRGLLSLAAIDDEYFGHRDNWTRAANRMAQAGHLSAADARKMIWLDVFGQLTANTDRHFGNLSFFVEGDRYELAPVYDMLPMLFAPVGPNVVERQFLPSPPAAENLAVWHDAAEAAVDYWKALARHAAVSSSFRTMARLAGDTVARARDAAPAMSR